MHSFVLVDWWLTVPEWLTMSRGQSFTLLLHPCIQQSSCLCSCMRVFECIWVSMNVCMCVLHMCECAYINICMWVVYNCLWLYVYVALYVCVCVNTVWAAYVRMCIHKCMCVWLHVWMCVHVCDSMSMLYMCACVYVYVSCTCMCVLCMCAVLTYACVHMYVSAYVWACILFM